MDKEIQNIKKVKQLHDCEDILIVTELRAYSYDDEVFCTDFNLSVSGGMGFSTTTIKFASISSEDLYTISHMLSDAAAKS